MLKKYTNKYNDTIGMVEIIRETKASVFFKDRSNCRKISGNGGIYMGTIYADTPKEVSEFIKTYYKDRIASMKSNLDYKIERLNKFEKYWGDYKNES